MRTNYTNDREEDGRLALPVDPQRDHMQGPSTATLKLVEYADYECPYCGAADRVVKALQETLGNKLCYVFRNFPLTGVHPHAEQAAEAAEAAQGQGKFWEMHDLLFEHQDRLEDDDLVAYAQAIGLDIRRFISDLQTGAPTQRVREDFQSGVASGVNGTPSFFINELRYEGSYDYHSLLGVMDEILVHEERHHVHHHHDQHHNH